jgi:hypothetical protein
MVAIISALIVLLATFVNADAQSVTSSAAISVRVIDNDGPVVAATVTLKTQAENRSFACYTDDSGQCGFSHLRSGFYSIEVLKPSYLANLDYSGRGSFELTAAQNKTQVIPLAKGGVISGKLVDEDGEPLCGVPVVALPAPTNRSSSEVASTGTELSATFSSDDRGSFRIYGLRPGVYILAVNFQRTTSAQKTIPATYYPNQFRPDKALPIPVPTSKEVVVGEIKLTSITSSFLSVSGVVRGLQAQPLSGARVSLTRVGEQLILDSVVSDKSGEFSFDGLPSGAYSVQIASPSQPYFEEKRELILKEQPISNLSVQMSAYPIISGTVYLRHAKDTESVPNIKITISPLGPGEPMLTDSDARGEFSVRTRQNGPFYWDFEGLADDVYLDRIMIDGRDVTDDPVSLNSHNRAGIKDVRIYLATGAAAVKAKLPSYAEDCSRLAVFAINLNEDNAHGWRPIRARQCFENSLILHSLPPGDYRFVAFPARDHGRELRFESYYGWIKLMIDRNRFKNSPITLKKASTYDGVLPIEVSLNPILK